MTEHSERRRDSSVQSVNRAISILQVIAQRRSAGVIEIADELSVHKSTVSRLLGTLEARGLVEQVVPRGPYQLAYGVVKLAQNAGPEQDLAVASRGVSASLAQALGETVNVVVPEGSSVMTVDQVVGAASLKTVNWVGMRSPMHATASGKVFLAALDDAQVDAVLADGMEALTEHTIVDAGTLKRQLDEVRSRGYASIFEEQELGACAVAAPIRTLGGSVVAALTISGPTARFDASRLPGIIERGLEAAAQISERNGFPRGG